MKKLLFTFSLFYSSITLCSAPASAQQPQKKYTLTRTRTDTQNITTISYLLTHNKKGFTCGFTYEYGKGSEKMPTCRDLTKETPSKSSPESHAKKMERLYERARGQYCYSRYQFPDVISTAGEQAEMVQLRHPSYEPEETSFTFKRTDLLDEKSNVCGTAQE